MHCDDVAWAPVHPGLDFRAEGEHGGEGGRLVVLEWETGDAVGEPIEAVLIFRAKVEHLGGVSASVIKPAVLRNCGMYLVMAEVAAFEK